MNDLNFGFIRDMKETLGRSLDNFCYTFQLKTREERTLCSALSTNSQKKLHKLVSHPNPKIRAALPSNDSIPAKDCLELSKDVDSYVRIQAISSPHVSLPINRYIELAQDEDKNVQLAVANKISGMENSLSIYYVLSNSPHQEVLFALAGDRNAPSSILDSLSKSKNDELSKLALDTQIDIINDASTEYICGEAFEFNNKRAANRKKDAEFRLKELLKSDNDAVRMELAMHPFGPEFILNSLISDINAEIRLQAKESMTIKEAYVREEHAKHIEQTRDTKHSKSYRDYENLNDSCTPKSNGFSALDYGIMSSGSRFNGGLF